MTIQDIIQQPEGRRLEFKEKLPSKADICKTIIAFANDEIIAELERLKRNISFDSEPILDIDYHELLLAKLKYSFINETGEKLNETILKKLLMEV